MDVTLRELPVDEWNLLTPLFEEQDVPLPEESMARIFVAEDEGKIVGFVTLQFALHLEPVWTAPSHRHHGIWKSLAEVAMEALPQGTPLYAFAPRSAIVHRAQSVGLEHTPWAVMKTKES